MNEVVVQNNGEKKTKNREKRRIKRSAGESLKLREGAGRRRREREESEEYFKNGKSIPLFDSVYVSVISLLLHLPTHLQKTSF